MSGGMIHVNAPKCADLIVPATAADLSMLAHHFKIGKPVSRHARRTLAAEGLIDQPAKRAVKPTPKPKRGPKLKNRIVDPPQFRRVTDQVEGRFIRSIVIKCGTPQCETEHRIVGNPSTDVGVAMFTRRHWICGPRPKDNRCPACNPNAPRARFAMTATPSPQPIPTAPAIAVAPIVKAAPMLANPPAASAPRAATPANRRAIADQFDANYDVNAGRYLKAGSDENIAKALDVPRAWVAEVREFSYGSGAGNEAGDAHDAFLVGIERRLIDALFVIDQIDRDLKAYRAGNPSPRKAA